MKEIAQHFLRHVITHKDFFSDKAIKDMGILFPPFREKVEAGISKFNEKYPDVKVIPVETYRSNERQMMHYNNGASKIKKDGMHHFAIAIDLAGEVKGKFTYDIDYKHLRRCIEETGLTLLGVWDMGHSQYIPVGDQGALRKACYGAVEDFQRQYGLKVDGEPGSKTATKAKEVFANEIAQAQAVGGKNSNKGKAKP